MNLYLLARRLPKHDFVATGAWFFFVVNLVKLPIYVGHGLIGRRSLLFDLALAPAVVAGALLGRVVLRRMPQAIFDKLVMALTVCAAGAVARSLIAALPRAGPVLACARGTKRERNKGGPPWRTRRRF